MQKTAANQISQKRLKSETPEHRWLIRQGAILKPAISGSFPLPATVCPTT